MSLFAHGRCACASFPQNMKSSSHVCNKQGILAMFAKFTARSFSSGHDSANKARLTTVSNFLLPLIALIITASSPSVIATEYILPLKDANNRVIPFVSSKPASGFIDGQSRVSANLMGITIGQAGSSTALNFKKFPVKVVNELGRVVPVAFESIISCNESGIYAGTGTSFNADHYEPAYIDDTDPDTGILYLTRKLTKYVLSLKNTALKDKFTLLQKTFNARSKNKSDGMLYDIKLVWNDAGKSHVFHYWDGEEFKILLPDSRLSPSVIPYTTWSLAEGGAMEGEFEIGFSPFRAVIELTGNGCKELNTVELISEKEPGNTRRDTVIDNGTAITAQFIDLDWAKSPFRITTGASGCYMEPIIVDINTSLKDLNVENNQPILKLKRKVWSYVKRLDIQIVNNTGDAIPDLLIIFKDSPKLTEILQSKIKNSQAGRPHRLTDLNGEVMFTNIYDWENALIAIFPLNSDQLIKEIKLKDHSVEIKSKNSGMLNIKVLLSTIGSNK